jgi:hypothetical protein
MRMFKNRVLMRICGPKRKEITDVIECAEKCAIRSFIICNHHQILLGTSNQKGHVTHMKSVRVRN